MSNAQHATQRIIPAPPPVSVSGQLPSNCVLSVMLEADEDVEWV